MVTSGYGMGKIWHNGRLEEDYEIVGKEDRDGIQLIVRDKDEVEYMRVPNEKLFDIVLQQPRQHPCLDERISMLLSSKPKSRKSSNKSCKRKPRKSRKAKSGKKKTKRTKRLTCYA
jgi:hypothetical protein